MKTGLGLAVALLAGCGDGSTLDQPDAAASEPIVIAVVEQMGIGDMAADEDGVYFAASSTAFVGLLAVDAGETTTRTLHQGGQDNRFVDISLAGGDIAYLVHNEFENREQVFAVAKAGGPERLLYEDAIDGDAEEVWTVAAANGIASYGATPDDSTTRVVRIDLSTGAEQVTASSGFANRLAVDATHTYWVQDDGIWRTDGTSSELFTPTSWRASAMTVDASHVYWIDSTGLWKVAKETADEQRVRLDQFPGPTSRLVVDDERAYWLTVELAKPVDWKVIYSVPLDGSAGRVPVASETGLADLAATTAGLYYSTNRDSDDDGLFDQGQIILRPRASL